MKSLRIAVLAAALFAIVLPRAVAGKVTVDIYSGFDLTNPPTEMPLTDHVGQMVLPSTAFGKSGYYDFGHPFGLNSFAAIISFTMYMSADGYYSGGLNSGAAPVFWLEGYPNYYLMGWDWMVGGGYGEAAYTEGYTDFQILYIAIPDPIPFPSDPNMGTVGGEPYLLNIIFPEPWGGDPRVAYDGYSYVVPDSIETLGGMVSAMLALLAISRKYFRRAA